MGAAHQVEPHGQRQMRGTNTPSGRTDNTPDDSTVERHRQQAEQVAQGEKRMGQQLNECVGRWPDKGHRARANDGRIGGGVGWILLRPMVASRQLQVTGGGRSAPWVDVVVGAGVRELAVGVEVVKGPLGQGMIGH